MFRNIALIAASALTLTAGGAIAAGEGGHVEDVAFAHEGPFGKFDQFQLQRGLQVFTEVCSACHGLKFVPLRTLSDEGGPGLPEDQVRAYAAQFTVTNGPAARLLCWWMARATSSLPLPVSPWMRTVTGMAATRPISL